MSNKFCFQIRIPLKAFFVFAKLRLEVTLDAKHSDISSFICCFKSLFSAGAVVLEALGTIVIFFHYHNSDSTTKLKPRISSHGLVFYPIQVTMELIPILMS
jgi:hypothetical protein